MGKYKNYHYHPIWNERVFDRIAADADHVLIERHKMDICRRRQEVFKRRWELRHKPYLTIAERHELANLDLEWDKLMLCGDVRNEAGK